MVPVIKFTLEDDWELVVTREDSRVIVNMGAKWSRMTSEDTTKFAESLASCIGQMNPTMNKNYTVKNDTLTFSVKLEDYIDALDDETQMNLFEGMMWRPDCAMKAADMLVTEVPDKRVFGPPQESILEYMNLIEDGVIREHKREIERLKAELATMTAERDTWKLKASHRTTMYSILRNGLTGARINLAKVMHKLTCSVDIACHTCLQKDVCACPVVDQYRALKLVDDVIAQKIELCPVCGKHPIAPGRETCVDCSH